jgi:hypothetical protein
MRNEFAVRENLNVCSILWYSNSKEEKGFYALGQRMQQQQLHRSARPRITVLASQS